MYRDYRSGRYHTPSSDNDTALQPPWATNTTATAQPRSSGANSYTSVYGVGNADRSRGVPSRDVGGASRAPNDSRARRSNRIRRSYGSRFSVSPFDRDLPFFLGMFPHRVPSRGSVSSRERERERRERNVVEERRAVNEERARTEVEPEVPMTKNVLTVQGCDLHLKDNTKAHRTDLYECTEREDKPQLVVRRGQPFYLTFTFQRPWDIKHDDMMITLELGDDGNASDGTLYEIPLDESKKGVAGRFEGWDARLVEQRGNAMKVAVFIPANAIVGEWTCGVTTSAEGKDIDFTYKGVGEIFVLFNPWCRDDQVYFTEDPSLLDEYILNEHGCLFEGSSDFISRKPWYYAQFREGILDVTMTILRMSFDGGVTRDMSDVITVCRNLSRILNNTEGDPGVMTGNWSGRYADGTRPSDWPGSLQLLTEYRLSNHKRPIKYAQCFVFSHVFTTVLRALGIPSRSITNFDSAHDTDKTATVDTFVDEAGDVIKKRDSIWNYHCWNDVWINRPDLDLTSSARDRYSGWHAVDCTPQERSNGRFQCGPSPLKAIKNGEVSVGFDTQFIYGEVNGEVCTWCLYEDPHKEKKLIERKPNVVGHQISTKKPTGNRARGTLNPGSSKVHEQRLDITSLYKYPENSEEERNSLKMAIGNGFASSIYQNSAGVELELGKVHHASLGSDFEFKCILVNQTSSPKRVDLTLAVYPNDYTGERIGWGKIAYQKFEGITLNPKAREVFALPAREKVYVEQCDNSMTMMFRASARLSGEEKPLSKFKRFVLAVPEIVVKNITPAGKLTREQPFTVNILVTNPCSKPMSMCQLRLSGSIEPIASQGFTEKDGSHIKTIKDIFPGEIRNLNIEVRPKKRPMNSGSRELDVDVISVELPKMSGSFDIQLIQN